MTLNKNNVGAANCRPSHPFTELQTNITKKGKDAYIEHDMLEEKQTNQKPQKTQDSSRSTNYSTAVAGLLEEHHKTSCR